MFSVDISLRRIVIGLILLIVLAAVLARIFGGSWMIPVIAGTVGNALAGTT